MTVNVSNTATTNTWEYWRNRTNELAFAQTYKNVTVGSNTAIGDASISGTFSGGDLIANNTTTSTTNATGALVVKGGAGIAENLNVGGTFDLDGIATFNDVANFGQAAFSANVTFGDGDVLSFGAAADLELSHDGVDSVIKNGTGLKIDSDLLTLRNGSQTETTATFATNGAVTLYYDNAAKVATTATGVDVTGTVTSDGLTVDGAVDLNSTIAIPGPGSVTFDDFSGNELQFVRVNTGGTALEYSNSIISSIEEIADVEVVGSLANSDVFAYNITTGKFQNYPRSLLDITGVSEIDNVDGSGAGNLLVKTGGATGLTGTTKGYVAGRLDNVSETTFTSQTGTSITHASDANSHIQVFKNGVKLVPTTDFTHNTTTITLVTALDTSDIVQVVEFDPTAIVAADGTATDVAHADYSDMRLKENINLWQHNEDIYNLNTYTFYWQDKDRFHEHQEVGFMAQELEQHVPQVITKNAYGERQVHYGKMTAVLLSLIKEQKSQIENLEFILKKNGIE